MPLLPHSIPAAARAALVAALAASGLELDPLKPGVRITHTVTSRDVTWRLTYLGSMVWGLTGPNVEHGLGVFADEAAAHIAAYGARDLTYRGVPVPPDIADAWQAYPAEAWRGDVNATLTDPS
ncbi:hypothetical protein [Streptomyces sp. NRRL B-1347]|uniref:hypothetical protein n=1 Tax=Streptomyces sp. NRRL B-1347 TaxID=1476877 RepID=UPI0004C8D128|nr:hypothetical protein [Streptomyces sp. NRRL B-1347]